MKVCGAKDYKKSLQKELDAIHNSEMWMAGAAVRSLRPQELAKAVAGKSRGTFGRGKN
jgi:ketol-acid reductoisomerase